MRFDFANTKELVGFLNELEKVYRKGLFSGYFEILSRESKLVVRNYLDWKEIGWTEWLGLVGVAHYSLLQVAVEIRGYRFCPIDEVKCN